VRRHAAGGEAEDRVERAASPLGTPPKLPIERIHIDTQAAQAGPYTSVKPRMVPPGIYFVDQQLRVVELLQGEVKAEEITAVLKRGGQ
jgi:hypothetical protein